MDEQKWQQETKKWLDDFALSAAWYNIFSSYDDKMTVMCLLVRLDRLLGEYLPQGIIHGDKEYMSMQESMENTVMSDTMLDITQLDKLAGGLFRFRAEVDAMNLENRPPSNINRNVCKTIKNKSINQ